MSGVIQYKPVRNPLVSAADKIKHGSTNAVKRIRKKSDITKHDPITWSAFHASFQSDTETLPVVSAMLPLFYEKSTSPTMIKHAMDVIREAVQFLNPAQIPVATFDQPLFPISKWKQWKFPDEYGDGKYVVMLGVSTQKWSSGMPWGTY